MRKVKAAFHEHLRTCSRITPDLVSRTLDKARERLGPGGVFGVINFNSRTSEDPRWNQFAEHSINHGIKDFGNSLYFPAYDLLAIRGQEIPTQIGHLLAICLPKGVNISHGLSFPYTVKQINEAGGLAIVDHPFGKDGCGKRLQNFRESLEGVFGYEVFNAEVSPQSFGQANRRAKNELVYINALKNKVLPIISQDGHSLYEFARTHMDIFMPQSYSSFHGPNFSESVKNSLVDGVKLAYINHLESKKDRVSGTIGAVDHIADLILLTALGKMGFDHNTQIAPAFEKFGIYI